MDRTAHIARLRNQIGAAESRIADLRKELDGLNRALAEVSGDEVTFESQVDRKRRLTARTASLSNVRAACGYAEVMNGALNGSFQSSIAQCFGGMKAQIRNAMHEVEAELAQQQALVQSLEGSVRDQQRLAAQEEAQAQALEKAAQAARESDSQGGGSR